MRNAHFAPACTDLNRDLISIANILPPVIYRRNSGLANNLARSCVGQRQHILRLPGNGEQQLMLAFRPSSEGAQPCIDPQTFYKGG